MWRFRLILAEAGTGHAQHCPYVTGWRGRFQDQAGKWHTVEACDGYRADLDAAVQSDAAEPHRVPQEAGKQPVPDVVRGQKVPSWPKGCDCGVRSALPGQPGQLCSPGAGRFGRKRDG